MKAKKLLAITAALEVLAGLVLVLAPSTAVLALLGLPLNSPANSVLARLLGASLFSLGIACWFSRDEAWGLVRAMLAYNVAVVAFLIHAFVALGMWGMALPIAVILHSVLAVWCGACIKYPSRIGASRT